MKKATKFTLSLSLFCIVFGGALALFGSLNGGVNDIKQATAPQKVEKEVSAFKDLQLELTTRNLTIEPSKDNKWHLSYYTDGNILGKLKVNQEGERLNLKQSSEESIISGLVTTFGYYLNNKDKEYQTVVLSVPKETNFKTIKGYVSKNIRFYNFDVEHLDITSDAIYTDDTRISQATLSAGALFLDNTHVQQLNLTNYNYLSLTNSVLKNANLSSDYASTDIDRSQLSNTTLTNTNNTIKLSDTSLDNVNFLGEYNDISATNLTLNNLIELNNAYNDINLALSQKTKTTTNFNLSVTDADLEVSEAVRGTTNITSKDEELLFTKQVKQNTATLTIHNKEGNLTIN